MSDLVVGLQDVVDIPDDILDVGDVVVLHNIIDTDDLSALAVIQSFRLQVVAHTILATGEHKRLVSPDHLRSSDSGSLEF